MIHRVESRQVISIHPQTSSEELFVIRCFETKKEFTMRVILFYDKRLRSHTGPQGDYSYCPYCGVRIDGEEKR